MTKLEEAKVIQLKKGKEYIFIFQDGKFKDKDKRAFGEKLNKRLMEKGFDITILFLKDPDKFRVVEK